MGEGGHTGWATRLTTHCRCCMHSLVLDANNTPMRFILVSLIQSKSSTALCVCAAVFASCGRQWWLLRIIQFKRRSLLSCWPNNNTWGNLEEGNNGKTTGVTINTHRDLFCYVVVGCCLIAVPWVHKNRLKYILEPFIPVTVLAGFTLVHGRWRPLTPSTQARKRKSPQKPEWGRDPSRDRQESTGFADTEYPIKNIPCLKVS